MDNPTAANSNLDEFSARGYAILDAAVAELVAAGMEPEGPWRFMAWAAAERLSPEDLPRLLAVIKARQDVQ
jgi:hypothetical protein